MLAVLSYLLLFAAPFCFGVSALIAVALAYARKADAQPPALGHYRFQVRIFWVGLLLALLSAAAVFFGIGVLYGDVMAAVKDHVSLADYFAESSRMDLKFHPTGVVAMFAGAVLAAATAIWLITTSVFGLVRIASGKPIGR